MTAALFDFRVAPVGQSERRAIHWLTEASQAATKLWHKTFSFLRNLRLERVERRTPERLLASLEKSAVGLDLNLTSGTAYPGFVAMDRPFLLALVGATVGENITALPADRELTHVERSLVDLVIPQFLAPLTVTWPGEKPLQAALATFGLPKSSCRLTMDEPAIEATLSAESAFGTSQFVLAMPQFGPFSANAAATLSRRNGNVFDRSQTETVMKEMPIEFSVMLGQTQLSLRELAELKPGDVLVLGQRIVEPLAAKVEGVDRFTVSPGAIGRQQAVRIHSIRSPEASQPVQ